MNRTQENNNDRLNQEITEELYNQTFRKDITEFIPEKVEHLVGLLEIDHATAEQEVNEAQNRFEEYFRKTYRREIRRARMKRYRKRFAAAAVLVLLLITADITTKAVIDESLCYRESDF